MFCENRFYDVHKTDHNIALTKRFEISHYSCFECHAKVTDTNFKVIGFNNIHQVAGQKRKTTVTKS